ncbi:hypothetical protein BJ912DRAFT_999277, partial [Pholiota molesta]
MANDFCDIPQELQVHILSNLDAVSLIRCAMTCKSIYDVLESSSLLVYTIQLHLDGLKDGGTTIPYPDLIGSLARRRQAWLSPERIEPVTLYTQDDCRAYELAGGAFASTSENRLEILWLPTSNGVKGCTLQEASMGISVRDFTMDPTQDLIILLEDTGTPSITSAHAIHIRAISSTAIHPLAKQSPLQFTGPFGDLATAINYTVLQIARDIVALYYRNVLLEPRVLIWDWITSELILDSTISFDPFLRRLEYNFGLLDSTYCFATDPSNVGSIRLYKLDRAHDVTAPAIHLATLYLPRTSPGTTILRISSHAGPIEANSVPYGAFIINDDDRLHVFTAIYQHRIGDSDIWRVRPLVLFLHQRVFAQYAHRALTSPCPLDIVWEEWGPLNTMFTCQISCNSSRWIRYIHGQRYVLPASGRNINDDAHMTNPSRYVDVLDFSLTAVLSAKGVLTKLRATPSPNKKPRTPLPSSIISVEDVPFFVDDVETHLPCLISTLDFTQVHEAYMIHDDGIIGLNVRSQLVFSVT